MVTVVIIAVVLLCGTTALLVWQPSLTSLGIRTEPKRPEEKPTSPQGNPRR